MKSNFSADFFKENRNTLAAGITVDAMIIPANGALQRNSDLLFPFRQDSNFFYLTGLDFKDLLLVVKNDGTSTVLLPTYSDYQRLFDGAPSSEQVKAISGVDAVLEYDEAKPWLDSMIKKADTIGLLEPPEDYIQVYGMYTNPARKYVKAIVEDANPDAKITDLREQLAKQRMVKQAPEIAAIRAAIDATDRAFAQVGQVYNSAKNEAELSARLHYSFELEQLRPAYENIVSNGKRACQIHYIDNNQAINHNLPTLIDSAAEVQNYGADITRTILGPKTTQRHKDVHAAVREVQLFAMDQLVNKPSVRELERAVRTKMGEQLLQLGLIDTKLEKHIAEFYPHAVSHFLGLDTHDAGDYDAPLAPGMIITVEPGIYIKAEQFGVRIEDDVLITEDGFENMSQHIPLQPKLG